MGYVDTDVMSQHEFHANEESEYLPPPAPGAFLLQRIPETDGQLLRVLLWLLVPLIAEQVLILGVSFSDYILTGKFLADEHLAAITSTGYLTWFIQSVFCFVSVGVTAMVARFCGEWNTEKAAKVMNQAFFIGAIFCAAVMISLCFGLEPLIDLLGLGGEPRQYASEYLWILMPAIPFVMCSAVGLAALRGAGNMVCGLWIMGAVNAVNIFFSWVLVCGFGPFPLLGWKGIAVGTSLGLMVGGTATLLVLRRGSYGLRLSFRQMVPDLDIIRRVLWISVPGGLDMMTIIGCQIWFISLINMLGVVSAAAHGVAMRVESLGFAPLAAFQTAIMTLVGQLLGAKRPDLATRATYFTLAVALVFIFTACLGFFVWADILPYVFLKHDNTKIAAAAAPLLRIIAFGLPPFAVTVVLAGVLRGAGDTRCPLLISFFGFLFIRILLTYYLAFPEIYWNSATWRISVNPDAAHDFVIPGMNFGVAGAWIAMSADLWVRSILMSARFLYGKWKRLEV